ncbi:MAG: hypothetical protein E7223_02970 [Clostridiales bacterium]|nr:hypothetical protein [Clostridiales bacterium]
MFLLAFLCQISFFLLLGNFLPLTVPELIFCLPASLLVLMLTGVLFRKRDRSSPFSTLFAVLLILPGLLAMHFRFLYSLALPEDRKTVILFFLLLTLLPFFCKSDFPAVHEAPLLGVPAVASVIWTLLILLFSEKTSSPWQLTLDLTAFLNGSMQKHLTALWILLVPSLQLLLLQNGLSPQRASGSGRRKLFTGSLVALLSAFLLHLLSVSVLGFGLAPDLTYLSYSALGLNGEGNNTGIRIVLLFLAQSLSTFTAYGVLIRSLRKSVVQVFHFPVNEAKSAKNNADFAQEVRGQFPDKGI